MKIPTFEDILKKFACHVIMNIHLKTRKGIPYSKATLEKILALIDKYDCRKYVYFMSKDYVLLQIREMAPDIALCCGAGNEPWTIVDRAIANGFQKVQFFKPYFNQEMVDKARAHGIKCNVFWSDDPEEALQFLDMGMDTILTNDYNRIAQILKT